MLFAMAVLQGHATLYNIIVLIGYKAMPPNHSVFQNQNHIIIVITCLPATPG